MNSALSSTLPFSIKFSDKNKLGWSCISADGKFVATTHDEGSVRRFVFWDVENGRALLTQECPAKTNLLGFSPDNSILATNRFESESPFSMGFQLWHARAGVELPRLPCELQVGHLAFSDDGRIAVGGAEIPAGFTGNWENLNGMPQLEGVIEVWPSCNGGPPLQLRGHTHLVAFVAFSRNGRFLASSDIKGSIRIWDLQTGQQLARNEERTSRANLTFVEDDQTVLSIGGETVSFWNWSTNSIPETKRLGSRGTYAATLLCDGRHLVNYSDQPGCGFNTICLWDARTASSLGHLFTPPESQFFFWSAAAKVPRIAITHGKGESDLTISFLDLHLPAASSAIDSRKSLGHGELACMSCHGPVCSVAIAPDARIAISASGKEIQLWSLPGGFRTHRDLLDTSAESVSISNDGKFIAAADANGKVYLWNSAPFVRQFAQETGALSPASLAFSPDSQYLAVAGGRIAGGRDGAPTHVVVFDVASGREILRRPSNTPVDHVSFQPIQGGWELLWVSGEFSRCVIESLAGGKQRSFKLCEDIGGCQSKIVPTAVQSTAGSVTICGYDDIFSFEISTGQMTGRFKIPTRDVRALAFSADGRNLVAGGGMFCQIKAGSHDYAVRVFDSRAGSVLATFNGHTDRINTVAIAPAGDFVLSGSDDCTLRLWRVGR